MMELLYVCIGGFFGAIARFLMFNVFSKKERATLFVNVSGSFLLVLFMPYMTTDWQQLLIAIGFFGAYTTFSTFTLDAVQLAKTSKKEAALYVVRMLSYSAVAMLVAYMLDSMLRR